MIQSESMWLKVGGVVVWWLITCLMLVAWNPTAAALLVSGG